MTEPVQEQVTGAVEPAPAPVQEDSVGQLVWRLFKRIFKGAKTLLFFGATSIVGLLDMFATIDLRPMLQKLLGDEMRVGEIIAYIAIAGILLRLVTSTSIFGDKESPSGQAVDDPEVTGSVDS